MGKLPDPSVTSGDMRRMRNTIKKYKRFKIGASIGVFICILVVCFSVYFTPGYVANNLSSDGILGQDTIFFINFIRLCSGVLSNIGFLICVLFLIKPHIFIEFFSKPDQIWKKPLKLILFFFPIVFVLCIILAKSNCPWWYQVLMATEDSTIEWLTFISYFLAFIFSLSITIIYCRSNSALLSIMYMLFSVGLFFIAMEEISWGQRIFHVSTPELLPEFCTQFRLDDQRVLKF